MRNVSWLFGKINWSSKLPLEERPGYPVHIQARKTCVGKLLWITAITLIILTAPSPALLHSSRASSDCSVLVTGQDSAYEGETIQFQAKPTTYDSYQWEISAGVILGPRNTSSIMVVNLAPGSSCRATVTIRSGNCTDSNWAVTQVRALSLCPTGVEILAPDSVEEGAPLTLRASPTSEGPVALGPFNWTISAGTITQGQGEATITVDTTGLGGQSITAAVELGGLAPTCPRPPSRTINVTPKPRPFAEYGSLTWKAERLKLGEFAIRLQNEPGAEGYIIGYPSRRASRQTNAHARRVKNYLISAKHIQNARVKVLLGAARARASTELWIVPQGSAPPRIQ